MSRNSAYYLFLLTFLLIPKSIVAANDSFPSSQKKVIENTNQDSLKTMISRMVGPEAAERIYEQSTLEKEGLRLEELGLYDEAIKKYQESILPKYIQGDGNNSRGLCGMAICYHKKGEFEKALKIMNGLVKRAPRKTEYAERKQELEALIKARDTKNNTSIYEFISYLKEKHKNQMPPHGHNIDRISTILHLYDYMGDVDSGIKLTAEAIQYLQKKGYGTEEYWEMRRAFEADKKAGAKGRATKILMRSKYFFW